MSRRASNFGVADSADQWAARKRGGDDMELDITPMIDVTFLLLIFFMVSSTMQAQKDLEVPPAVHGVGVDKAKATIIEIKAPASSAELPEIVLGPTRNASIDQVRAYVEEGKQKDHLHVIVKADGRVPEGFVQQVLREITAVEGVDFSVGVRDKRFE